MDMTAEKYADQLATDAQRIRDIYESTTIPRDQKPDMVKAIFDGYGNDFHAKWDLSDEADDVFHEVAATASPRAEVIDALVENLDGDHLPWTITVWADINGDTIVRRGEDVYMDLFGYVLLHTWPEGDYDGGGYIADVTRQELGVETLDWDNPKHVEEFNTTMDMFFFYCDDWEMDALRPEWEW